MTGVYAMIRYHIRFVSLLLFAIILFCFAMFQGGFVSWFIFFAISPFLLYAMMLHFTPLNFAIVERTIYPTYAKHGDDLGITVSFRNKTAMPLAFLLVREMTDEHQINDQSKLIFVGFKRHFKWTYEIKNVTRGEYHFQGLELVVTDFFGWVTRTKKIEQPHSILVYPKTVAIPFSTMQMQYDQGTVLAKYTIMKDTTMATGVRNYQPGDRFSWIHWKSFAKGGTLRTKEFEDRQAQRLLVCIQQASRKHFEQAVSLTASIMQSIVKHQGEVSFATAGENRVYMPFVRTDGQLEKVMRHLAVIQANGEDTASAIVRSRYEGLNQSILIIVTGEFTKECQQLLLSSTQHVRAIICFVIVTMDELKSMANTYRTIGQNRVIYLTEDMFSQAFTEVNRP
ncbi:DUF58 domain-containing protein [Metasolibacillus meyeri]|uniref:DUF58 domain-containing protein n=1 Tax=Metasolibacillus meyeri TaxID=1071052 RepID=A0AAW9NZ08_9BACL|nr:DUF58 domain-containing protein [Metasolibacillus meyeri]MEC1180158.1 DUF58 domain-containing protein [Metasolibacillus meyeri]